MSDPRLKIISDIEASSNVMSVRKPFKLSSDQKRRFIRLEISEPMKISILKDNAEGFWPDCNGPEYSGSLLNLSAGGALVFTDGPVQEGMIVLLTMSLQDVEIIDRIVGLVKRVDDDSEERLIGIEFVSRARLSDLLSHSEIEFLSEDITSFDEKVRTVLDKYVFRKRVSKEVNR